MRHLTILLFLSILSSSSFGKNHELDTIEVNVEYTDVFKPFAYPNPFTTETEFKLGSLEDVRLQIFDISGNLIHDEYLTEEITFGIDLREGMYFAKISSLEGITLLKLIKKK